VEETLVRRHNDFLSMALIVSALLFLMACPFKKSGGAGDAAASSDESGDTKPVHYMGGDNWVSHERHTRFSMPKLHHTSDGKALPRFLEDQRPSAGAHRGMQW
jgi:hypothetical protein